MFHLIRNTLFLWGLFLVFGSLAQAEEFIKSYNVNIFVLESSTISVEEVIEVHSENSQIRHGIYRDFITKYSDPLDRKYNVDFKITSLTRDGSPEEYSTEKIENGVRVYFGSRDRILDPGDYTYRFRFKTNFQLGYYEHDELYFQAIGNSWNYPIHSGEVTVFLPDQAKTAKIKAYGFTGAQGIRGKNYKVQVAKNIIEYTITKELAARNGFTIVVEWPKGMVYKPTIFDKLKRFIAENLDILVWLASILFTFAYYGITWLEHSKNPKRKSLVSQYNPPDSLSPAACRYQLKAEADDKMLAASIVNLAVNQFIIIDELQKAGFVLQSTPKSKKLLSNEDRAVYDSLFSNEEYLEVVSANHRKISAAKNALATQFKSRFDNVSVKWNMDLLWVPLFAIITTLILSFVITSFQGDPFGFLNKFFFVLSILIWWIYRCLIRNLTSKGRETVDKIQGFKMFLGNLEDSSKQVVSQKITAELFEKYLPFALALDCENLWVQKFEKHLGATATGLENYSPVWYHGTSGHNATSVSNFISTFCATFVNKVSVSSNPPTTNLGSGLNS